MSEILSISIEIAMALVAISVALALVRLVIGPSLPDRVVALDMMTVTIVAFCGLAALRYQATAFLDVALALALVGFLATVALARFAERARASESEVEGKE